MRRAPGCTASGAPVGLAFGSLVSVRASAKRERTLGLHLAVWMDRRMEGWMDGRMDGWMDGRKDGWMEGWMEGGMDGWDG